jgi:DNA polymerase-1
LFVVPEGRRLVGIDASALELCMLAHYMRDDDFTKSVSEGTKEAGTDVHTRNKVAAGLDTRDQAKTFILI